jgi:hypothetical protein
MKQTSETIPEAPFIPRFYQELHIDNNLVQVPKLRGIN